MNDLMIGNQGIPNQSSIHQIPTNQNMINQENLTERKSRTESTSSTPLVELQHISKNFGAK